jgi:hypothetical protein
MRNNSTPSVAPVAGQYTSPHAQVFTPSRPDAGGRGAPIPATNVGITAQQTFAKINRALTPGPIAKIVIRIQQARF